MSGEAKEATMPVGVARAMNLVRESAKIVSSVDLMAEQAEHETTRLALVGLGKEALAFHNHLRDLLEPSEEE